VVPGETFKTCIQETSKNRNVGIVQVDIYVPKDQGAGEARTTAVAAGKYFQRLSLSVAGEGFAQFKESSISGRGEQRGRYKHMAVIPYYYDFDPA
jgi:hypothetical protein